MGSFIREYFDFMEDDRLVRRLKRKHVRNKELMVNRFIQSVKRALEYEILGGGMVDEDYASFFKQVVGEIQLRNSMVEDDNESDEDDPDYQMFLKNLKEDGKSYVLQVAVKNEVSLYIKYEAEDSSDDELEPPGLGKPRSVTDTKNFEATMMDFVGSEMTYSVVEKDMTPEPVNHAFCKENGFTSDNPCSKDSHLFQVGSEHEMEVEMVDECYQIYLNGIRGKDDSTISATEDAELMKLEKVDDKSSSESEVVALNASDFGEGKYSPFETSKLNVTWMEEDDLQCLGNPNTSNHSRYREKLMEKLSEPYDQEEYNKLFLDIKAQRLKERSFHFRSGVVKSCKKYSEAGGPSYLDQYPVLYGKIHAVLDDKYKVLNLLRGFFFWLQNLVQNDAFPPWLDPWCLEVMPRNSA